MSSSCAWLRSITSASRSVPFIPNLDGATDLKFEDLTPAEAAKGCDVALLALPHKVTAAKVPELIAAGVKIVDMSGDFRLRDAASYEKHYGAKHPHPELLGTFVYGLARAQPRTDQSGEVRRVARMLRDDDRARAVAARAGRHARRRRDSRPGHHRLVGLRHRTGCGNASPVARRQLEDLQAARSPARPRDRADAR